MKPTIPDDLPPDARAAYLRGWQDRGEALARMAGKVSTADKAAAARANGEKGGRPRKSQPTAPAAPTVPE